MPARKKNPEELLPWQRVYIEEFVRTGDKRKAIRKAKKDGDKLTDKQVEQRLHYTQVCPQRFEIRAR